jgi:predicted secreted protein
MAVLADLSHAPCVAYLAHCLLNANAKVDEGARCAGVFAPLAGLLSERGWAIRQMPCPELAFAGLRRFWAVREQYDTPVFRSHARRLAGPVAAMIAADRRRGAAVVVIGLDGSPTMGVELTASGADWGGRPDKPRDEDYPVVAGTGLFTESLRLLLAERGIGGVRFCGIAQDAPDYDEPAELRRLAGILDAAEAERAG